MPLAWLGDVVIRLVRFGEVKHGVAIPLQVGAWTSWPQGQEDPFRHGKVKLEQGWLLAQIEQVQLEVRVREKNLKARAQVQQAVEH